MKAGIMMIGLLAGMAAHYAHAADDSADIPQVSGEETGSRGAAEEEKGLLRGAHNENAKKDYQNQILSNPEISDIGRANALTSGGGNTAVVVQEGSSNHSSIRQSGHDNYAVQKQKGKHNDYYLNQQGNNNHSREEQIGDYNHKVKIQNNTREESTTEGTTQGDQ